MKVEGGSKQNKLEEDKKLRRNGGKVRTFALGGYISSTSTSVNTVEEWMEESSTWKGADSLTEARFGFGAVAVPRDLVCPA